MDDGSDHSSPASTTQAGTSVQGAEVIPRATIVVVNYDNREHLRLCLESLRRAQGDAEIVVVDNASADCSAEYVEAEAPEVRLIRSRDNLGFGQAANLGASSARGEILAFLNPDLVVDPAWLKGLLIALDGDPQAGLATSRVLLMSEPERMNAAGNEIHCTGLTLCRGLGRPRAAYDCLQVVDAVSGAAFVIRRKVFEQLGGFDAAFFMYFEDTDLSWRARLAGYRCLYVPDSVVFHDYRLSFGPCKTFYEERNRYLMLLKGWRWPTLLVLLPTLLLGEVVTWGFVLLHERDRLANKVRAYAWIIRNWHLVMATRRRAQALRRVRDRTLLVRCTYRLDFEQTAGAGLSRAAHLVFDPIFFVLHRLALALVWW